MNYKEEKLKEFDVVLSFRFLECIDDTIAYCEEEKERAVTLAATRFLKRLNGDGSNKKMVERNLFIFEDMFGKGFEEINNV